MSNANVEWRMPNGPMSPDGSCHVAIRDQYIIGLSDPGPPDDVMSQRYTIHIGSKGTEVLKTLTIIIMKDEAPSHNPILFCNLTSPTHILHPGPLLFISLISKLTSPAVNSSHPVPEILSSDHIWN